MAATEIFSIFLLFLCWMGIGGDAGESESQRPHRHRHRHGDAIFKKPFDAAFAHTATTKGADSVGARLDASHWTSDNKGDADRRGGPQFDLQTPKHQSGAVTVASRNDVSDGAAPQSVRTDIETPKSIALDSKASDSIPPNRTAPDSKSRVQEAPESATPDIAASDPNSFVKGVEKRSAKPGRYFPCGGCQDYERVKCKANPCNWATCERFPEARCLMTNCGGCFPNFWVTKHECVTLRCNDKQKGNGIGNSVLFGGLNLQRGQFHLVTVFCVLFVAVGVHHFWIKR